MTALLLPDRYRQMPWANGKRVTEEHVRNLAAWQPNGKRTTEIPFIVVRIALLLLPVSCRTVRY